MIHYPTLPHPDDLPVYVVSEESAGQWRAKICFSNGDSDDLGLFPTEDEAKASAEQWLDEYATLDQDDERFLD